MPEFVRIFQSAVDPTDLDEVRRLFVDDVRPAFERSDGCLAIELLVSSEKNAGGLLEGAAVSRWTSRDTMDRGVESRDVRESLVRILGLLQQEPVTRVFEVSA